MHQGSVLSPFIFAVVVDVVTQFAREVVLCELLYADDLDLVMTMEGLMNKFLEWKESFESKGLRVKFGIIKVLVCGGITKDDMSKSKFDPYWVCSLRVRANSVLCLGCGSWIHSRCAGVEW